MGSTHRMEIVTGMDWVASIVESRIQCLGPRLPSLTLKTVNAGVSAEEKSMHQVMKEFELPKSGSLNDRARWVSGYAPPLCPTE